MYKSKPLFLQDSFPLTKALAVTSFSECRIFLYFYYVFLYHEKKIQLYIELHPPRPPVFQFQTREYNEVEILLEVK